MFSSSSVMLVGAVTSLNAAKLLQAGRKLTGKDESVGSNSYFKKLREIIPLSYEMIFSKLLGYQLSSQCSGSLAHPSAPILRQLSASAQCCLVAADLSLNTRCGR